MPVAPNPEDSSAGPPAARSSLSRRELLKKAGWAVPAIVALPLLPGKARAHGYASPGGRPSFSKSGSKGSHDKSWSFGSSDHDWSKKKKKGKKDDTSKKIAQIIRRWFSRR